LPQIDAGTTKVLSFVCDVPDPAYPQYKTAKELGYNISLNNSIGLAVHPSVDPEIKKVLSDWLAKLPNDPEYQKLMSDMGLAIDYLDSSDFLELTETEIETVKAVLAAR
jgi:tripartite-type tricarboxylate transporter receptor subunit TctC